MHLWQQGVCSILMVLGKTGVLLTVRECLVPSVEAEKVLESWIGVGLIVVKIFDYSQQNA